MAPIMGISRNAHFASLLLLIVRVLLVEVMYCLLRYWRMVTAPCGSWQKMAYDHMM
jgi:hypothetical protein